MPLRSGRQGIWAGRRRHARRFQLAASGGPAPLGGLCLCVCCMQITPPSALGDRLLLQAAGGHIDRSRPCDGTVVQLSSLAAPLSHAAVQPAVRRRQACSAQCTCHTSQGPGNRTACCNALRCTRWGVQPLPSAVCTASSRRPRTCPPRRQPAFRLPSWRARCPAPAVNLAIRTEQRSRSKRAQRECYTGLQPARGFRACGAHS